SLECSGRRGLVAGSDRFPYLLDRRAQRGAETRVVLVPHRRLSGALAGLGAVRHLYFSFGIWRRRKRPSIIAPYGSSRNRRALSLPRRRRMPFARYEHSRDRRAVRRPQRERESAWGWRA